MDGLSFGGLVLLLMGAAIGFCLGAVVVLWMVAARATIELRPPKELRPQKRAGWFRFGSAVTALVAVSGAAFLLKLDKTGAALILLLVVLVIARLFGALYGLAASVGACALLSYLFLPPVGSLRIDGADDWLAFALFAVSALAGSHFVGRRNKLIE